MKMVNKFLVFSQNFEMRENNMNFNCPFCMHNNVLLIFSLHPFFVFVFLRGIFKEDVLKTNKMKEVLKFA